MGKIVLFLLVVLAAALYFDGSRSWMFEKGKPLIDPYFVMATQSEMEKIAQDLQMYERENFGRLPDRRSFDGWLERQYSGGAGVDSWGSPYEYTLRRDSFYLRSPGPDKLRATEDDIVEGRPRTGSGTN
ncbi:MAG: hypothetical protein JSU98_03590 [Gemmatimonadales bacterium]|jgi:hypothetical protein|nr:MAG: hypothetical protein JSU98_03590 [Gemmatimonadales bacterium]